MGKVPKEGTENETSQWNKDLEIFKIVKETRDFEITMFWRRTNYFLLLNSAVGGALLVSLEKFETNNHETLFFSIIGLAVCFAWIRIGLGGKYWQSHWEQVLVDLQRGIGLVNKKDIFSTENTDETVERNLGMKGHYSGYDSCVLSKPSVSRWMHRTACFFFIVWLCIFCFSIYNSMDILSWLKTLQFDSYSLMCATLPI